MYYSKLIIFVTCIVYYYLYYSDAMRQRNQPYRYYIFDIIGIVMSMCTVDLETCS